MAKSQKWAKNGQISQNAYLNGHTGSKKGNFSTLIMVFNVNSVIVGAKTVLFTLMHWYLGTYTV